MIELTLDNFEEIYRSYLWMKTPTLIASYPRSGSTYLRLLLTNIMYPDNHDIDSVNRHIPTIESKDEILKGISYPRFYKTHELRNPAGAILLHRHVGDCLVSEFHYHKNYHDYEGELIEFLEDVNYGKNWRKMIDHYYPCQTLRFENLIIATGNTIRVFFEKAKIRPRRDWLNRYEKVVEKCNFDYLQKQDSTFFRSGKIDQWKELDNDIQEKILEKNWMHLKILGYKI